MTASAAEVYAVAATVWDQDTHSEADMAFLDAVNAANKKWSDLISSANVAWGAGSPTWKNVKYLATRSRDAALVRALAELEASEFPEFMAEAAE